MRRVGTRPTTLVAIGDSNAAGEHDPHPDGGFIGWVDRLAAHLHQVAGPVAYANLAVSGQTSRQIIDTQLDRAVQMQPDHAIVVAGVNDMLRPRFDAAALRENLDVLHSRLAQAGARVLCFTMPDLTRISPPAALLRHRLDALNAAIHRAATRHGSLLVDLAAVPMVTDPRVWHDDRLHASAEGHRRIAAAVAEALGHPLDPAWRDLPPRAEPPVTERITGHLSWLAQRVTPWVAQKAVARAAGEPGPGPAAGGSRPDLATADDLALGPAGASSGDADGAATGHTPRQERR